MIGSWDDEKNMERNGFLIVEFVINSWFVFRWPYGAELEELSKKVARLKSPAASPVLHGLAPNLCIVAPRPEG